MSNDVWRPGEDKSPEKDNEFMLESYEKGSGEHTHVHEDYDPSQPMSFEDIRKLDEKYVLPVYARMPVAFQYGSGEFLYDTEGIEYIDFLSGIAVNSLGHSHPDLIETLASQADRLWHTSNIFFSQNQAMLARALVEITFPGKVFFANSGAEANEAALKIMRAYGQSVDPKKNRIVALENSFHGRTFGAMSMTGQGKIHNGFGPIVPEMIYIEANDKDSLMAAVDSRVCGIIMEPILGEGGVLPLDPEYLQLARDIADEFNAMFTLDEVQTGMGRTGKYFTFQHYHIVPDMLTIAKGLGGGFPIGAAVVAEKFTKVLGSGAHGSTFGGNHLGTAVGYEVIRTIESGKILENVVKMSTYLMGELRKLAKKYPEIIRNVRGMGLLIGIVLPEKMEARDVVKKALEKNLVIGRAGNNVLRLAPPLIVRKQTIDRVIERLDALMESLKREHPGK